MILSVRRTEENRCANYYRAVHAGTRRKRITIEFVVPARCNNEGYLQRCYVLLRRQLIAINLLHKWRCIYRKSLTLHFASRSEFQRFITLHQRSLNILKQ